MIDMGQYDAIKRTPRKISFAPQKERELRNKAIETDLQSDWEAWRKMRAARIES